VRGMLPLIKHYRLLILMDSSGRAEKPLPQNLHQGNNTLDYSTLAAKIAYKGRAYSCQLTVVV
jgi:hypothetical protein